MANSLLRCLASLKLTVGLLACWILLLFVGTLAQVELGVWQAVAEYFRSPIAWVPLGDAGFALPLPGGLLLGSLLAVNLVASLALRWRYFLKRPGLLVVHLGLLLLIAGEAGTAAWAEEGLMSIREGESASFAEDIRTVELVLIEPQGNDDNVDDGGAQGDHVVRVPTSVVLDAYRSGEPIRHAHLPVTVEVLRWHPNASLIRAQEAGPASHGIGATYEPRPEPQARGVDGADADLPAALVRLRDAATRDALGTWLLSPHLQHAQPVEINGTTHGVALRFRRLELPVRLHLHEFRFDRFVGTQIPRNYSSRVDVFEDDEHAGREVLISMNQPLRTHGYTFYQSSFSPDEKGTVLQVVRNPAADFPYIAGLLVGLGLFVHFLGSLRRFARRRQTRGREHTTTEPESAAERQRLPRWQRIWPWGLGGAVLVLALGVAWLPSSTSMSAYDLETFRRLPVTADGRLKPLDSAARELLMVAGGRQTVRTDAGTVVDPVVVYLDLVARPERARSYPLVRVDHPELLALLGRAPEQGGHLALEVIEPTWREIVDEASRAREVDASRRSPYQRAVVQLHVRVERILAHVRLMQPYLIPPRDAEAEWQSFHDAFLAENTELPAGHPPLEGAESSAHPAVAWYVSMMSAYHEHDSEAFNRAAQSYAALVERDLAEASWRAQLEVWFNRAQLFNSALALYLLAVLLFLLGFFLAVRERPEDESTSKRSGADSLRRGAFALMLAAFVLHTLALVLRMYLQERPPITNLYSSAVFVGWAAVLGGIFLERIYRSGLAGLGAGLVAFLSLVVAQGLGGDGDTMQMMQAVLDSNFWLATHVITITLGYSASFLAGTLAALYLVLGMWTKQLTPQRAKTLASMVYAAVCFALLLSFVGTVLGGIWADQSWGRFWGWDPKENGAAMIVLLHAIILHARWGGILRQRGLMVLAVGANIITAWSWFGTNMLGVGLHSYGFMESGPLWLITFVVAHATLMLLGAASGNFTQQQRDRQPNESNEPKPTDLVGGSS